MDAAQNWQYVGFWKRVVASFVDTLMLMLITVPLLLFVYGTGYWSSGEMFVGLFDVFVNLLLPAILVILLWCRFGATPGKMMFGARIVDATTGDAPSTGQLIGRYFGYYVSILPLFLGLIWVAFDARKQGWHDKMAGTVVVSAVPAQGTPATFNPRL